MEGPGIVFKRIQLVPAKEVIMQEQGWLLLPGLLPGCVVSSVLVAIVIPSAVSPSPEAKHLALPGLEPLISSTVS